MAGFFHGGGVETLIEIFCLQEKKHRTKTSFMSSLVKGGCNPNRAEVPLRLDEMKVCVSRENIHEVNARNRGQDRDLRLSIEWANNRPKQSTANRQPYPASSKWACPSH